MAGDPSLQLSWHLSQGTVGSGNLDADLALGGARANPQIRHKYTTVASPAAVGDTRLFLTAIDSAWETSICYIRDGVSGGFSSIIIGIDIGSGWVDLLEPLPTTVAAGDNVWAFNRVLNIMPFKTTTPAESAAGFVEYCGLYVNNNASTLNGFRFWLEQIDPGPVEHAIAASSDKTFVLPLIADRWTEPDLSGMLAGGGAGRFISAPNYDVGSPAFSFGSGAVGFWLRRTAPANAQKLSRQRIAVVAEDSSGISSRLVVYWNTDGFTPVLSLTHAPTVYLRGGCRFKARLTGLETGLPVPGVAVGWSHTSGPGTLSMPPDPGETDENGEVLARYAAPTDVGEIGQVANVEVQV